MDVGISVCISILFLSCRTWHSSHIYVKGGVLSKKSKYQDFHSGASNVFIRQPPSAAWRRSSQVWSKSYGCVLISFTSEEFYTYITLCDVNAHSQVASRVSSLDLSHVDVVNKTWKFGGDEKGYNKIKNLITNFPTCCITDEQGQPVSWVLLYDYCAMGFLYTMPEHRGKGHAKVLISTMARRLSAEGFPVYCFIEEENTLSYKLFTKLGFIEDPTYRAAWFEFNFWLILLNPTCFNPPRSHRCLGGCSLLVTFLHSQIMSYIPIIDNI